MKRSNETILFYRKQLPHWEVREGLYFVTLRQTGSLPVGKVDEIRRLGGELEIMTEDAKSKIRRLIFKRMEAILDYGHKGKTLC